MTSRFSRLGRLLSLSRSDLADLFRAQWELLVVRFWLMSTPTGELVKVGAATAPAPVPSDTQSARAKAIALSVERAAEYGLYKATCLRRATAIQRLLNREGILGSHLRLGVRNGRRGFEAHAWVELGDLLLGDLPQHVAGFTVASDLRVVNS
jgi:hypothetical protein